MKHKAFTTQLSIEDYKTMEVLRTALGMKRSEFIKYLLTMFLLAYPEKVKRLKEVS